MTPCPLCGGPRGFFTRLAGPDHPCWPCACKQAEAARTHTVDPIEEATLDAWTAQLKGLCAREDLQRAAPATMAVLGQIATTAEARASLSPPTLIATMRGHLLALVTARKELTP